jgi:hypothetical protein
MPPGESNGEDSGLEADDFLISSEVEKPEIQQAAERLAKKFGPSFFFSAKKFSRANRIGGGANESA